MQLISENLLEDQLLPGLVSLLRDLKVDAVGFLRDEAVAPIFWSHQDIAVECASIREMGNDEIHAILEKLEPELMEAMIQAGFEVIEKYLKNTSGVVIYPKHRNMSS